MMWASIKAVYDYSVMSCLAFQQTSSMILSIRGFKCVRGFSMGLLPLFYLPSFDRRLREYCCRSCDFVCSLAACLPGCRETYIHARAAHRLAWEMSLFVPSFLPRDLLWVSTEFVYLWSADTGQRHPLPTRKSSLGSDTLLRLQSFPFWSIGLAADAREALGVTRHATLQAFLRLCSAGFV
jgi:hypothetical protein